MATYNYKAVDKQGEEVSGVVNAENVKSATSALDEQGYFATAIEEASAERTAGRRFGGGRISVSDMASFTRQLATLVRAALPLHSALTVLARQIDNERLRGVLVEVGEDIRKGEALSAALANHPRVFAPLFVSLVRAGEAGGSLDVVLEKYADYVEEEDTLRQEIRSAMIYPALMTIVGALVVIFLLAFVVPKFVLMFGEMGQVLPLPTRILLKLSGLFTSYAPLLAAACAIAFLGWRGYVSTPGGRWAWDYLKLKVPVFGALTRKIIIARFSMVLGVLIEGGVPVLQALSITKDTLGNRVIERELEEMHERVGQGEPMSPALEKSKWFYPMVGQMTRVGEETGKLEEMMARLSSYYERECRTTVKRLTPLIEPVIIMVMGLMVGFVVMAVLLPIFSLSSFVR